MPQKRKVAEMNKPLYVQDRDLGRVDRERMGKYVFGKLGIGQKWHILLDSSVNARKDCQRGYAAAHSKFRYFEPVGYTSLPSDVLSMLPPEPICETCMRWFRYNRPDEYHEIFKDVEI